MCTISQDQKLAYAMLKRSVFKMSNQVYTFPPGTYLIANQKIPFTTSHFAILHQKVYIPFLSTITMDNNSVCRISIITINVITC